MSLATAVFFFLHRATKIGTPFELAEAEFHDQRFVGRRPTFTYYVYCYVYYFMILQVLRSNQRTAS